MAESVASEATTHKEAPQDPMEPYRKHALETFEEQVKEGVLPQTAVMNVLAMAQATGDPQVYQAVLEACKLFPAQTDTAQ